VYADAVAKLAGESLPYWFGDFHGFVEHKFGDRHRLSLTGIRTFDRTGSYNGEAPVRIAWGNDVLGMTFRSAYESLWKSDSTVVTSRASYSGFSGEMTTEAREFEFGSRVSDFRISSVAERHRDNDAHQVGVEFSHISTRVTGDALDHWIRNLLLIGETESTQPAIGAWYAWSKRRGAHQLTAGIRGDAVKGSGAALSPRLSIRSELAPETALTFSFGRHVQWIHSALRQEQPLRPLDFWLGGPHVPMSHALVATAGIDRRFTDGRQMRFETFYRRYSNLADRNTSDDPFRAGDEFERIGGTSKGFEVLLRPSLARATKGWLSYTFAHSKRIDSRGAAFTPAHDRRHELNLVAIRKWGSWSASSRFNLASGTPYTPLLLEFSQLTYDPGSNRWGVENGALFDSKHQYATGARNSSRLPFSHRLDLGIARTGADANARFVPYFSIANAYGAFNPWLVYDQRDARPERLEMASFRFLPSIGLKYVF
jgi:hypothetical protein